MYSIFWYQIHTTFNIRTLLSKYLAVGDPSLQSNKNFTLEERKLRHTQDGLESRLEDHGRSGYLLPVPSSALWGLSGQNVAHLCQQAPTCAQPARRHSAHTVPAQTGRKATNGRKNNPQACSGCGLGGGGVH